MIPDEPDDGRPGRWTEPEIPKGSGEPHPPSGGFTVRAQDLVNASKTWDDISASMREVHQKVQVGWGYPSMFGMADTLYTVGRMHETFNRRACDAAWDGSVITGLIANGLVEVANDYSNTDTTQGANFQNYQKEYE
jgi:hypothetical protein